MPRTRSKRAREETTGEPEFLEPEVAVRKELVMHGLLQHSIRTLGLQKTLANLDESALTRPLAETIRVATTKDSDSKCSFDAMSASIAEGPM